MESTVGDQILKTSHSSRRLHSGLSCCLLLGLLSGCAVVGPDYSTPQTPLLPTQWSAAEVQENRADLSSWWQQFNDPVLNQLVDMGASQNLSIEAAGLRIVQARAALGFTEGLLFPQQQQLSGSLSKLYQQEQSLNSAGVGLDVGWELDFWGKYARGIESAEATMYASVASYRNVMITISAEIARNYINYRTAEERIHLSRQNVALQQRVVDMTQVQFDAGNVTELDVQQATTQLYTTKAGLPALNTVRLRARNALALLLGTLPEALTPLLHQEPRETMQFDSSTIQISRTYNSEQEYALDSVIPIAPAPEMTIDAQLVMRRPDLQVAELLARSQSARIGLTKANLYPSFVLFGSIGMSEAVPSGSSFSASNAVNAAIGPGFSWNILQYDRIKNQVRVEDAAFQESLSNYNQSVLGAVREVSDALDAYRNTVKKSRYNYQALNASVRAFNISATQYNNGLVTYQRLLSTVEKMTLREDVYATTRGDIANQVVALYKALGGGWEPYTTLPLVRPAAVEAMQNRTDWDNDLDDEQLKGALPDE